MHDIQHIGVDIARLPAEVYEFASDPRNLPRWAAGLVAHEKLLRNGPVKRRQRLGGLLNFYYREAV